MTRVDYRIREFRKAMNKRRARLLCVRRRRHYRRYALAAVFAAFILVGLVLFGRKKADLQIGEEISASDSDSEARTEVQAVSEEEQASTRASGEELATEKPAEKTTLEILRSEQYPKDIIDLYIRYPETEQFCLDYKEKTGKIHNMDISKEVTKGKIPLFIQWDERWGYELYGGKMMAINACGPTTLAMVYAGLTGKSDLNPYQMAQKADEEGYYVKGVGTSWNIMTDLAENIGLVSYEIHADRESIEEELGAGHPVVCVMGPGIFTEDGHFVVLTGVDSEGNITLNDPNSREKSEKKWKEEEIIPQILSLWAFRLPERGEIWDDGTKGFVYAEP